MTNVSTLRSKVAALPEAPGVYLFKDAGGTTLYIGKAKSLKKRVQSYFSRHLDGKTQVLVGKIAAIEYRRTASEAQAQILEAALIKDVQPRYNIDLKDDKSFPWVRLSDEAFPVVSVCRRKDKQQRERAAYFGPYTNARLLRKALKVIREIFGFRSCRRMPVKACLYWRLGLCPAPCIGKVSRQEYKEITEQVRLFLESKYEVLINRLAHNMREAAKEKRFEEAARIRDRINALSAFGLSPSVPSGTNDLAALRDLLKLHSLPLRIEAFDISNISGKEATGSMVSFFHGAADKNNYRRFRIRTVSRIDDYDMLREVVQRRYSRVLREHLALPDAILIDGGRGHLQAAEGELKKLGLLIPLLSIAKDRENIYTTGRKQPVRLPEADPALNLIRKMRDEAHRFAISYHHLLRRKKMIGT